MNKEAKIEITCWRTGRVLFAHEAEHNTMRLTVEAAVKAGVDLSGANLCGANLTGADLTEAHLTGACLAEAHLSGADLYSANLTEADLAGADLSGAYLTGADLSGANLTEANLSGANLIDANLSGAYLTGADLRGADLYDANLAGSCLYDENDEKITLVGSRPIFQIGPIGSGSRYLIAFLTDQGLRLRTGCFFGTREQFEEKLDDTHVDNEHAEEYRAALALIYAHERLWMPADEASEVAIAKTIGQEGEQ